MKVSDGIDKVVPLAQELKIEDSDQAIQPSVPQFGVPQSSVDTCFDGLFRVTPQQAVPEIP